MHCHLGKGSTACCLLICCISKINIMPTLLQINFRCNSGSIGKIAEQIGSLAIERGWRSVIAYARGNPKSQSELIKIGSYCSVFWHGLETRIFDNHGLASRVATKNLVIQIAELKPDIIHLHNIHGYYLNYKILFDFLKKYNRPVVWTLHDCWAMTGHCCYFSMAKCDKWKTQCFNCPSKKDYPKSLLFDRSRQNYVDKRKSFIGLQNLHIVSVSNWLNQIVRESFLNYANLHTIHNGIDLDVFKPLNYREISSRYNLQNKKVLLGVANVWERRKGLADYLELRKRLSDDYVIVLIGLSKSQIESLPKGMIGISRTENQIQLAQWYSLADIVLNLSYQETFGLTSVEGFACGTPSIVYNVTASPELISDDTGLIVEPGNISQLVDAIKTMLSNPLKSENCRRRAEQFYDKDIAFQKYLKLYESLL